MSPPLGKPGSESTVVAAKMNRRRVFRKDAIVMRIAGMSDTGEYSKYGTIGRGGSQLPFIGGGEHTAG